jgi:ribosome-associated heat shock protein Hsp15
VSDSLRLDKWLWFARFLKSRSLASKLCAGGGVRINRRVVDKASAQVRTGDVLTFPLGTRIRVIRINALGSRRGPAAEAQTLYEDLSEPVEKQPAAAASRSRGSGRPTKADRRALDRLQGNRAD